MTNRPAPPPPARGTVRRRLMLLLIASLLLIPSVIGYEASHTFDDSYSYHEDGTYKSKGGDVGFSALRFNNIEDFSGLKHVVVVYEHIIAGIEGYPDAGTTSVTGTIESDVIFSGRIGYNINRDKDGTVKNVVLWIDEFDNFDLHAYTGRKDVQLEWNKSIVPTPRTYGAKMIDASTPDFAEASDTFQSNWVILAPYSSAANTVGQYGRYTYLIEEPWKNTVHVVYDDTGYDIQLYRHGFFSAVDITEIATGISYYSTPIASTDDNIHIPRAWLMDPKLNISVITGFNKRLSWEVDPFPLDPDESATLTVYIKNSQTGALIADANVVIDALVDGEYYPVTNRTEPSGIFTITLQPTGGGKPNPDGYRLIVTADGYNNPMPEINFTVDDYKNYIHCLLDPIAGGPVNENKTFIDFFVRDMSSNPISGATVKFGKYTLITNSAGYTVFEVDKNNNYTWTISKSGYGPLTGNAVIGNAPRHTINTVLAPIVTPTTTTPIPTSPPIGPTPTMTAPTGEHVSNWLEWFAAHFGMILGGGVEIGKIFMWLCFTVPVGVYVGKEAKAGAAGFMAGAGIVTLFFVLIGWVPIWLVVLLALIIGLLYAKVFNTPDNGGGR